MLDILTNKKKGMIMDSELLFMILFTALTFVLGFIAGFFDKELLRDELELEMSYGIDPDKLIAWIENYSHNYEYMAPPTTGEIIAKIQEMSKGIDEEDY